MHDVITIGAGTRDVFLMSDQFKFIESSVFSTGVGECVALGTKIELDSIVHTTGGGATNAAVTFARLGFKTAVVCRVGQDSAGRDLIIDLQREGVDTTMITRVVDGATGYSTLLTAPSGERTVLVYRGVSATFTSKDIPLKDCRARWFYLTSLGGNLELSKKAIEHAAKCGASVAWNPGGQEIKKGMTALKPILRRVSVLNINREEAEKLTTQKALPYMFRELATPGRILIITDGANGAYAHQDGVTIFAGTRGVKAVSRTGAGDAFGSGFVASYMKTGNVKTALAVGTLNAECVIQEVGAKAGLLRRWPTATLMKKVPVKILK
jgi:sugar/nucleoside kinase (ribokinase family)